MVWTPWPPIPTKVKSPSTDKTLVSRATPMDKVRSFPSPPFPEIDELPPTVQLDDSIQVPTPKLPPSPATPSIFKLFELGILKVDSEITTPPF